MARKPREQAVGRNVEVWFYIFKENPYRKDANPVEADLARTLLIMTAGVTYVDYRTWDHTWEADANNGGKQGIVFRKFFSKPTWATKAAMRAKIMTGLMQFGDVQNAATRMFEAEQA